MHSWIRKDQVVLSLLFEGDEMQVALYGRVSTKDKGQDTENQLIQLREYCKRMNWDIYKEYSDYASGSKTVNTRPQFESMMVAAYQKQFELVLFWSLDRFSREGVQVTFNHLQRLNDYEVKWKSYTEPFLDSSGPMGDAIIAIFACIAKQERVRLSERVKAGLDRAIAGGAIVGRPKAIFRRDEAIRLRESGMSFSKIAEELSTNRGTIYRALQGISKPSPLPLLQSDESQALTVF